MYRKIFAVIAYLCEWICDSQVVSELSLLRGRHKLTTGLRVLMREVRCRMLVSKKNTVDIVWCWPNKFQRLLSDTRSNRSIFAWITKPNSFGIQSRCICVGLFLHFAKCSAYFASKAEKKHDRASETDDDVAWQELDLQNLQFGIVSEQLYVIKGYFPLIS